MQHQIHYHLKHVNMKKTRIAFIVLLFSIVVIHGMEACSKNKEEESQCKTCKAFGIDGVMDEEEVCSEAEEAAFRSANPGRQITCQ
jgi:hypothetical protein